MKQSVTNADKFISVIFVWCCNLRNRLKTQSDHSHVSCNHMSHGIVFYSKLVVSVPVQFHLTFIANFLSQRWLF